MVLLDIERLAARKNSLFAHYPEVCSWERHSSLKPLVLHVLHSFEIELELVQLACGV